MLVDMGFQRDHVESVLEQSGGDVDAAVAILLNGPVPAEDPADVDLDMREAIRLSQLEEEDRRREEQEFEAALSASLQHGGPPRCAPHLAPEAVRPASSAMGAGMGIQRKAKVSPSSSSGSAPRPLQLGGVSALEVRRPNTSMMEGTTIGIDDLDNWADNQGDLSGSLSQSLEAAMPRRVSPQQQQLRQQQQRHPASRSGSRGSHSGGDRPGSVGFIGVEDLDGWTSGCSSVLSPALLPQIRRSPMASSAPRLFGAPPGHGFGLGHSHGHGGNSHGPSHPHGFSSGGDEWLHPGGRMDFFAPAGPSEQRKGRLPALDLDEEGVRAMRSAATAAAAGSRPPSRGGMHPMPRSGQGGSRGGLGMTASRSTPLLLAASSALTEQRF